MQGCLNYLRISVKRYDLKLVLNRNLIAGIFKLPGSVKQSVEQPCTSASEHVNLLSFYAQQQSSQTAFSEDAFIAKVFRSNFKRPKFNSMNAKLAYDVNTLHTL